jgi:hypothetical protein
VFHQLALAGLLSLVLAGPALGQDLEGGLLPGLLKAGPEVEAEAQATPSLELASARNEYEVFQLVLVNPSGNTLSAGLSLTWDQPAARRVTLKWYREEWIRIEKPSDPQNRIGLYPDALRPCAAAGVGLTPDKNLFLAEIHVPASCAAGTYAGIVRVYSPGLRTLVFPLRLKVWHFTLPEKSSLKTAFGLDFDSILAQENVGSDQSRMIEIFKGYYQLLAEHRLSPISVYPGPVLREGQPPRLDVSGCDALWHYCYDHLGFNTLRIPFDESMPVQAPVFSEAYQRQAQEYLKQVTAYLRQNGWMNRAYIYISTVDEPSGSGDYAKSRQFYQLVKAADPGIRYRHGEQERIVEENLSYCDILDVNLLTFHRCRARLKQLDKKEIGWYTAVGPKGTYPAYFIDRPSIEPRILPLFNYYFHIPRLLYWSVCWWRQVKDPYQEPLTYDVRPDLFANGDGSLVYPGRLRQRSKPLASLRLKMIRDGLEDYEYCMLLEKVRGRAFVIKQVSRILRDLNDFSRDIRKYQQLRQTLGEALDQAAENQPHPNPGHESDQE